MKRQTTGPLSRIVQVDRQPKEQAEITVTARPEECAALAEDFGIVAIRDLVGHFRLHGSLARLRVDGFVEAVVTQTCSVSLEPFEAALREEVEVDFTDREALPGIDADDLDLPDPIVNGRIDFGTLTAEFLALGLDPYPRKPGIRFEPPEAADDPKPLEGLQRLRPSRE